MSFRRYEDDYGGGPNRWDRDRFERVRAKSRPRVSDSFRREDDERFYEERERFEPSRRRPVWDEHDRFFEEERFTSPRRGRFDVSIEEDRDRYRGGKEIAPYMDRFDREPPARPGYIRRQSSWDAFDRKPYREDRRYEDRRYEEREGGGKESNDLRLKIRMGSPGRDRDERAKSHVDDRRNMRGGEERDRTRIEIDERDRHDDRRLEIDERRYEEPRYYRDDPPRQYRDPEWREYRSPRDFEDYNGARIIRERTIDRRARSPVREIEIPREIEPSRHEEEEIVEEKEEKREYKFEEKEDVAKFLGAKRGKTRMPKRLVHRRAITELGYPYEEEEDFYVVRLALSKDHIDECIKLSETYKDQEKSTYSYEYEAQREETHEEPRQIEAPPAEPETEYVETVTRKVIENPTDEDYERFRAQGEVEEIRNSEHGELGEHEEGHHSEHEDFKTSHRSHRAKSEAGSTLRSPLEEHHRSRSHKRSKSRMRSKSRRGKSRRRSRRGSEDFYERRIEISEDDDDRGKGRLEMVLPERRRHHHGKERDLKAEIRALEAERRAIKRERESEDNRRNRLERHRGHVSESSDDETIRIEKDRRGRLNLVRSAE